MYKNIWSFGFVFEHVLIGRNVSKLVLKSTDKIISLILSLCESIYTFIRNFDETPRSEKLIRNKFSYFDDFNVIFKTK